MELLYKIFSRNSSDIPIGSRTDSYNISRLGKGFLQTISEEDNPIVFETATDVEEEIQDLLITIEINSMSLLMELFTPTSVITGFREIVSKVAEFATSSLRF